MPKIILEQMTIQPFDKASKNTPPKDSYAEGKLTFTNIDIQHPVDSDGNTCSGTETINQIFDDKVDSSKFESDATSFAEIVTSKKEENGADESAFSWTFYKR